MTRKRFSGETLGKTSKTLQRVSEECEKKLNEAHWTTHTLESSELSTKRRDWTHSHWTWGNESIGNCEVERTNEKRKTIIEYTLVCLMSVELF